MPRWLLRQLRRCWKRAVGSDGMRCLVTVRVESIWEPEMLSEKLVVEMLQQSKCHNTSSTSPHRCSYEAPYDFVLNGCGLSVWGLVSSKSGFVKWVFSDGIRNVIRQWFWVDVAFRTVFTNERAHLFYKDIGTGPDSCLGVSQPITQFRYLLLAEHLMCD